MSLNESMIEKAELDRFKQLVHAVGRGLDMLPVNQRQGVNPLAWWWWDGCATRSGG